MHNSKKEKTKNAFFSVDSGLVAGFRGRAPRFRIPIRWLLRWTGAHDASCSHFGVQLSASAFGQATSVFSEGSFLGGREKEEEDGLADTLPLAAGTSAE